jgi:hypothetical protein
MDERAVGIFKGKSCIYPKEAAFHPSERFREYPFQELAGDIY